MTNNENIMYYAVIRPFFPIMGLNMVPIGFRTPREMVRWLRRESPTIKGIEWVYEKAPQKIGDEDYEIHNRSGAEVQ